jgi:Protein of unknown function (DUF3348)
VARPEVAQDATYAPILKRHQELQRRMEASIGPLRARVRQALAKGAPALRQLAALDALMEQTLGGREQKLLTTVPLYLERHFEFCRQLGNGLPGFAQAWQTALLAELDLRLQPTLGLMGALDDAMNDAPNEAVSNNNINEINKQ